MLHFFILQMYIMLKGLKCCITLLFTVLTVDKLFLQRGTVYQNRSIFGITNQSLKKSSEYMK